MLRTDFLASYTSYIEETSLQSLSVGFPIRFDNNRATQENQDGANSFLTNRLGVGIQYRAFNANDTERTNTGVKLGDFDIRDQVLAVGVATALGPRLSLGASGKYIGSKIQNESVNMFAFDGGAQLKLNHNWSAGGAIQNMGSSKAYIDQKDPLPSVLRLGVSRQGKNILTLLDVSQGRDEIMKAAAGVEVGVGPYLKVRGGVINDTTLEFSGGIGVRFQGPQKAPVLTAPRKQALFDYENQTPYVPRTDSSIATTGLANLTKKLTGQYKTMEESMENPKLAIFPFKSDIPSTGLIFSDLLIHQFVQTQDFIVTERSSLIQILEEQKLQLSGAINPEKAVKIGKILSSNIIRYKSSSSPCIIN